MTEAAPPASRLRALVMSRSGAIRGVLRRYHASNPRMFGSVARGDAGPDSDVDLMVDLDPEGGNPLMRIAGVSEELSLLLGVHVDVVSDALLRRGVSVKARAEAVSL